MFNCVSCEKVYVHKRNLNRHAKAHDGSTNSCGICFKTFTWWDKLSIHVQNYHMIAKNTPEFHSAVRTTGGAMGRESVIKWAPHTTTPPHAQPVVRPPTRVIPPHRHPATTSTPATRTPAIALQISSPAAQPIANRPDTRSPPVTEAHTRSCSPPSPLQCGPHTKNSRRNIKRKKTRMDKVNTPGFIEIESSLNRSIVWYFRKNVENIVSYRAFLNSIESELIAKLRECVRINPIKFNLKLEATYVIPNVQNSIQNRAFKTSARELYVHSNVEGLIDRDFTSLLAKEDSYAGKYSGFTLSCIDGLLLGVYEYTPMGGSSYLPLPESILNRKAVVNPQNIDQQCFKWAILAKHVPHDNRRRVGANYLREEHRYDFSALSVPTPVSEIKLFERSNPGTTVNLYGIRNCEKNKNNKTKSSTQSVAYPLRVADKEKADHFDLLLIAGKDDENHYAYITHFSRLASPQKNNREHQLFFCKRCFAGAARLGRL
ncbi:uncharacterized protein LOC126555343 [Aphis gossypii]|uniref:uncharacterized protein LOC126555343 n=1 Tax=Aphis gossypii TaxID=80765 RepID=UPI0021593728|nr:uncharacterized protein LOC126555343 [Aphis gossypii]